MAITRILMVDDERPILNVFSDMLQDAGYAVWTAALPDEAFRILACEQIDVVFLDQCLGPVLGLDLMQQMAPLHPHAAYVIVTANGSTDLAVEALKKGAMDFITKPFLVADLIKSIDYISKKRELADEKAALLQTLERKVVEKTDELNQVSTRVLSSLAQAMEKKDTGTYGHSRRVSHYSRMIAAALDFGDQDREDLKIASLLHDIGKIGITDFVLGKKGPLTPEERCIIRSHPQKGVEILKPLKQYAHILPSILHHHEHYDGSGYPDGLSGESIPVHGRIIAIADTYDAITSTRPYRKSAAHEHAMRELQDFAGRQFDPEIVQAFVDADRRYRFAMASLTPAETLGGRAR